MAAKPNRYLKHFTVFIISFLLLIFSTIFMCYAIDGVKEGFTPLIRRHYNPLMRHARLRFEHFSNNTQEHLNRFFRKKELL